MNLLDLFGDEEDELVHQDRSDNEYQDEFDKRETEEKKQWDKDNDFYTLFIDV